MKAKSMRQLRLSKTPFLGKIGSEVITDNNILKKSGVYLLFVILLLGLMGCGKETNDFTPNSPSSVIDDFIWEQPISMDAPDQHQLLNHPVLLGDKAIFHQGEEDRYFALDADSGEIEWDNQGIIKTDYNNVDPIVYKEHFYLSRKNEIYKINLKSGILEEQVSLSNPGEYMYSGINIKDDMLYFAVANQQHAIPSSIQWYKIPIDQLNKNALIPVGRPAEFTYLGAEVSLGKPNLVTSSDGDEIMIFSATEKGNIKGAKQKTDQAVVGSIYAYNLTQASIEWSQPAISPSGWNDQSIIDTDRIYFNMENGILCVDVNTGKKLWEFSAKKDDFHCGATGMYLQGDKLIAIGKTSQAFAIDKYSGKILWMKDDIALGGFGSAQFYDNKMYYNSTIGDLNVIDLSSGSLRSYQLGQDQDYRSDFKLQPLLIRDDGVIITSDGYRVLAFDLP